MKYSKKPTTYEEQINILRSRNLVIQDEEYAKQVLSCVNYYNLTGYLYTYKDTNGNYTNIDFGKVYNIYLCDKRINSVILYAIELVEHNLKTKIAYVLSHSLGAFCYTDCNYFTDEKEHTIFMKKFKAAVKNNKNLLFVKHHRLKYDGDFPIWVAVELFTFGMIWNFYKFLNTPYKKKIANEFNVGSTYLESWIECVSYLRNMSAHYMRLYRTNTQKTPKKSKNHNNRTATNSIFDIIHIMKFLSPATDEWNNYIISSLEHIFLDYKDVISPQDYGFPSDWIIILKK